MLLFTLFCVVSSPLHAEPQDTSLSRLFDQQVDSVVIIAARGKQQNQLGTGFIISSDGLIATNAHIVEGAEEIIVKLRNGNSYRRVHVLGVDPQKDIVILKVNAQNLKPVKLGNSRKLKIGQRVATIGNPLGLESTIADGLVSSLREVGKKQELLQISVPLSHGSSGGPLFNLKGEVVGITTASLASGQNLNFAVPIDEVKPLIKKSKYMERKLPKEKKRSVQFLFKAKKDILRLNSIEFRYYTIQNKDTLYSLAKRFNTTVNHIVQLNQLSGSRIYHGQRIKIPATR